MINKAGLVKNEASPFKWPSYVQYFLFSKIFIHLFRDNREAKRGGTAPGE